VTSGRDAGRLLGVDWGERRIGLALSDETRTLAQPLTTLPAAPASAFRCVSCSAWWRSTP